MISEISVVLNYNYKESGLERRDNMKRILVISDIHGDRKVRTVIGRGSIRCKAGSINFTGDYVDRGPNACAVIEKVKELKEDGAFVLKGNHEDMMIKALTTDEERSWNHWVKGMVEIRRYTAMDL